MLTKQTVGSTGTCIIELYTIRVCEEMSGGKARRGAGERRRSRGEGKGWDEGERCLERGSGVRDWKTEEARTLHSNQRMLRCV